VAFLSPQLLDLLRWGRVLSTAKAARVLGFRAARDSRCGHSRSTSLNALVLRYEPDNKGYQYEKELEDFITPGPQCPKTESRHPGPPRLPGRWPGIARPEGARSPGRGR